MLEKWPHEQVEPGQHEHELYSIAISLKRIADALQAMEAKKPTSAFEQIFGGDR